ncbi:MAG: hypothetical protein ABIK98_13960 [Pseudomonadota bacterium]
MTPEAPAISNKKYNVQELFDEILGRHLERLIGTRFGIYALPLNSIIISCLIMLMERENEIESLPSSSAERYTLQTLSNELEGMGFDLGRNMNLTTQEMIQKGYIQVDNDRLIPQKPAISTGRLLEKVFPGMPGMNLVAYFFQTIDEVKSERKDLNSAVGQFNQILHRQGVPLKKDPAASVCKDQSRLALEQTAPEPVPETPGQVNRPAGRKGEFKSPDTVEHPQVKPPAIDTRVYPSEPKILSFDNYAGKVEIKKVDFGRLIPSEDELEESATDFDADFETQDPQASVRREDTDGGQGIPAETGSVITPLEQTASAVQDPSPKPDFTQQQTDIYACDESKEPEVLSALNQEALDVAEKKSESDIILEENVSDNQDDVIQQQIAAFEKHLALECPMCRQSKVQAETTTKGKSYYKCTNKNCNFISWGRPHHVLCPQCNNPFLIESERAGKSILKCPRATCRYWQAPPWDATDNFLHTMNSALQKSQKVAAISRKPRKRVVKRKVVRRKK